MENRINSTLPDSWTLAATRDGRIFFVNDRLRQTTWLHPVTKTPIATGHQRMTDLPCGWERGINWDGSPYYVNHNKQETTLNHPNIKEVTTQPKPEESEPPSTPQKINMESNRRSPKKKKATNTNQVRSPIVKRPNQAPVMMQGWLWKQGSDAFMRWKKRWFVLADFCLFYYNGPEEDKVLGSILLPSYEVSSCANESKVNRKFAFKLEHQNMRTYYLATETEQLYQQWINVIALATLLQRESSREERLESILVRPEVQYHPASQYSGNDDEDSGFTSYHSRRYVGPSTQDENSPLNESYMSEPMRVRAQDGYRTPESGYLGNAEKYPNYSPQGGGMYPPPKPKRMQHLNPELYHHSPPSKMVDYRGYQMERFPQEPASVLQPANRNVAQMSKEDWGAQVNYGYSDGIQAEMEDYRNLSPKIAPDYRDQYDPAVLREKGHKIYHMQRPHSANFLEQEPEVMRVIMRNTSKSGNRNRPKSSGELYPDNEYTWDPDDTHQQAPLHTPHTAYPDMWKAQHQQQQQQHQHHHQHQQPPPPPTEMAYHSSPDSYPRPNGPVREPRPASHIREPVGEAQFLRSASARLASTGPQQMTNSGSIQQHPEETRANQQREESMKRLLEWKQRMLQSPLTKKAGQPKTPPMTPKKIVDNVISKGSRIVEKPTAFQRYRNSYSSDDEESGSGSVKIDLRRKLIREGNNMSDSEIQLRNNAGKLGGSRWSISAGDLLGKTHEELILLLIQLRRTQSGLQKAMDTCRVELEGEKRLMQIDVKNRKVHSKKIEELTEQLEECSKQFDVNNPLVNLVDNMVKLGNMYGTREAGLEDDEDEEKNDGRSVSMNKFNQQMQEKRLVNEERDLWAQIVPDQGELQDKLDKLMHLDACLQRESIVLNNLQQDKEMLEKSLISLKGQQRNKNESEKEKIKKQQKIIEKELDKVQIQLINTTRKLEDTANENAKMEKEILILRHKIQQTLKRATNLVSPVAYEDTETAQLKIQLEQELAHVQEIMDELSKKRREIVGSSKRPSPTGVQGAVPLPGRKVQRSTYLETDLDTMHTRDVVDSNGTAEVSFEQGELSESKDYKVPVYVNTEAIGDVLTDSSETLNDEFYDINEADDKMKRFYGIIPREKPEIKTVRIVKRESERRNKEREKRKVNYDDTQLARVIEEDDLNSVEGVQMTEFQRSMSLPRNYGRGSLVPVTVSAVNFTANSAQPNATSVNTKPVTNVSYYYRTPTLSATVPSAKERLFGNTSGTSGTGGTVDPVLDTPQFKSEAARQIVAESALDFASDNWPVPNGTTGTDGGTTGTIMRRRYKRRHNTISSSQPLILEAGPPKLVHARSRDDLDMERCLRAANTPDVVKSTIKKNENFDESTIDRELGVPQKIVIPERYVEEEEELTREEQLHRIQKAESIKKMLSESTTYGDLSESDISNASETLKKKFAQEKKQREQLLTLNQLLAQEVKERSKAVAAHVTPKFSSDE